MKTSLKTYLDEYHQSHQNPTNIKIHLFCVPAIMFSLLGMLQSAPTPVFFGDWFNWSYALILFALSFYSTFKNVKLVFLMSLISIGNLMILDMLGPLRFWICSLIFCAAWGLQFYGHKMEGQKPSFFKDLFFLLIGPLWVLKFFLAKFGVLI